MRYYITRSEREDGILEIISGKELVQMRSVGIQPEIIDSRSGRRKAFFRVRDMLEKAYNETGKIDVSTLSGS